jgi:hypothetical protein
MLFLRAPEQERVTANIAAFPLRVKAGKRPAPASGAFHFLSASDLQKDLSFV